MSVTKIVLRNYNSITDFPDLKKNLEEANLFDPEWDSEERLTKRSHERPNSIIVATVGNQFAGSVFLIDDFFPFIYRLAVLPQFRKQGIGVKLMDEAIKRAKAHGHKEIALFVDVEKENLKNWYSKQNFEQGGAFNCLWKKI